MTPRVTVIVPTRERRTSLARALAGVDAQTYRDLELIVVDDASTDGSADWVREHHREAVVLRTPAPRGAAAARNLGIGRARGELVALLDDDDVWHSSYLENQVAALDAHEDAMLSYADHVGVDAKGRRSMPDTRSLLPDADPLVRLLADCPIHTSSVVVCRRSALERFGPYDERLRIVHDWEWYARVVSQGAVMHHLERSLVERGLPGGLITAHRAWCREESAVLTAMLAGRPAEERLVRTYRALFFARVALRRGDIAFGFARLAESLMLSPRSAAALTVAALRRRARPLAAPVEANA